MLKKKTDVYIFFCTSLFQIYSPICIVAKIKIFFSEYEMVRVTIVILIISVDRVRTPECNCVPRWKNKFCSAEKNSHCVGFLVPSDDGITIVTAGTNLGTTLETDGLPLREVNKFSLHN